jgi:hypothetical protein
MYMVAKKRPLCSLLVDSDSRVVVSVGVVASFTVARTHAAQRTDIRMRSTLIAFSVRTDYLCWHSAGAVGFAEAVVGDRCRSEHYPASDRYRKLGSVR